MRRQEELNRLEEKTKMEIQRRMEMRLVSSVNNFIEYLKNLRL